MMLMLKNRLLDTLASWLMWLALRCECWRSGHQWQCWYLNAYCEHCEARVTGDKALRKFGERCARKPQPPHKPWPPIHVVPWADPDRIYFLNLRDFTARLPSGAIAKINLDGSVGKTIVPAAQFPPIHRVEEGGPILSQEQWDLLLGKF